MPVLSRSRATADDVWELGLASGVGVGDIVVTSSAHCHTEGSDYGRSLADTCPHPTAMTAMRQKRAAAALVAGYIVLVSIPDIVNASVPSPRVTASSDRSTATVQIFTDQGAGVSITAPTGWDIDNSGNSATLRNGDAVSILEIFDRDGREPDAVTERLIRAHHVSGISSVLDGGTIATRGGNLTGSTCVAVTTGRFGTCAVLADDDVIVSVIALGNATQPAPSLADLTSTLTRQTS